MNLFSQSKLTLKLKKQNSASSSDLTKNCQKPEIVDSVKTELLSDTTVLSENDSFVEILHSVQPNEENISASQSIFKTTTSDQNTSNIVNENKQCPVCLQSVDVKKFITHVKSCGTSHNLSSKVLIKAVDLQERQAAEREALGLPILTKSCDVKKKKKCQVNKQTKLKIGNDSNLDLAIAMSVSLQESKNAEIIRESENLLEAGLEKEALDKRKTLENFGFMSNQPVKSKPKNFSKTNSLLFKQTKEDREKRITEKVAMILIDVDTDVSSSELSVNHSPKTKLVSKHLNAIRNVDNELWKKSLLEGNVCEFYVKQLSKFIKPCERSSKIGLKDDFKSLTHQNILTHESSINNEELTYKLPTIVDNTIIDNICSPSHIIGNNNKTILEHSSKWKSLIGNQFMSDLTIFAKDELEIPAHSLVFYAQCPDILDDIVKEESETCKPRKILMWLEYSYEACLAFLELIYSGQEPLINPEFKKDYYLLGTRYNILMAVNDYVKDGWFSNDADKISKRKNLKLYDNPNDCKRFKASSPDMFMSDDENIETSSSTHFLGTSVDDEKNFSVLKTKQWLYSQRHNSSFTENLVSSVPSLLNVPKKNHSFHSTTTISLKFTSSSDSDSENNDTLIKSSSYINKPFLTDDSIKKSNSVLQNINNIADGSVTLSTEVNEITESLKEPELITINSDTETESIDMIFCNDIKKSRHNSMISSLLNTTKNEKKYCSLNSSNVKFGNYINTIELNDDSLDSINSACTDTLNQRNINSKSNHSLYHDSVSHLKDEIINIDDRSSLFLGVTNILPLNNGSSQIFSSGDNIIDLIEDSSDSVASIDMTLRNNNSLKSDTSSLNTAQQNDLSYLTPFLNLTKRKKTISVSQPDSTSQHETSLLTQNISPLKSIENDESYFTGSNKETSYNLDLNSSNSSCIHSLPINEDGSKLLSKSFNLDNVSSKCLNSMNYLEKNDIEDISKNIGTICSNENQNVLNNCNSDTKLLGNILTTSLLLPSNHFHDSCANTKEVDLTFLPSNYCVNNCSTNTTSPQVEPNQLSEVTVPNENDHELNKSNTEQIIDDPWMDYNDWQAVDLSPQYTSPILSNSTSMVFVDESEVQTPKKKDLSHKHLDIMTPSSISSQYYDVHLSKKNSLTPNKYSSKINTPKSLRRVQSESVIGSKQQVTPLPDYSSMKTPDLRKEFDRYGLKDLGRRKGKLILRHIYDVLHPLYSSEDNCNIDFEQHSSSSEISEHGIPDYEDGSCDEGETLNSNHLSNKISVEAGFKQLLRTNEDLHKKILCYEPIWIEELKEDLKQHNVNISMQKLMTFLDDKCVTFRLKSLNDQRQKTLSKKNSKRKKLF